MKELTITYLVSEEADAIRATVEVKDLKEAFDIINAWPHHVIAWSLRKP